MAKHVTIEFDDDEKAQAFVDTLNTCSWPLRWDAYDDRAYAHVAVIKVEDANTPEVGFRGPADT